MSVVSMKDLLEAGVHFGHQTRRWNPKMKRCSFAERGGSYIIDLQKTLELLEEAHDFARNVAARGGNVLFVGTKKQSQDAVEEQAKRVGMPTRFACSSTASCDCFFVPTKSTLPPRAATLRAKSWASSSSSSVFWRSMM